MSGAGTDPEVIAHYLATLASAPRLELLRALRVPRVLAEIRLAPAPDASRGAAVGSMSRQAVSKHLARLADAGVVATRPTDRGFGETTEYVVNHQRLFAISEEIRALARLRPVDEGPDSGTVPDVRAPSPSASFPRLLLVRGVDEGRAFELTGAGPWTIGRREGAAIALDYDPFMSAQHATLAPVDDGFTLTDLPESRNGTWLNFDLVPKGKTVAVGHGDVITAGRSVLVLQEHAGARSG